MFLRVIAGIESKLKQTIALVEHTKTLSEIYSYEGFVEHYNICYWMR
jgi:hypothetical protein